ncbi:MAG: energy transducer TonB [Bacteroidota bacterium]
MKKSTPVITHLYLLIIIFCASFANAQETLYMNANGMLYNSPQNAIVKFEQKNLNDSIFEIYSSAHLNGKWETPKFHSAVVQKSDSVFFIFDNKKRKGDFQIRKLIKKDVGLQVEQFNKNGKQVFSGSALQGFPLNLHGEGTFYDSDEKPMARVAFYRGKQTAEEFFFHPVDSSLNISKKPQFQGGRKAFKMEVAQKVRYPVNAQKNRITGDIYVKFIINTDGKMEHFRPARSAEKVLEDEGIQTLKNIKKRWQPGESNGNKIEVWHYAKIRFAQLAGPGISAFGFFQN